MDQREENARMLDPDRFKIAKDMSYMPGGPMMNNPMNVTNVSPQMGSMDGVNRFPYGDSGLENDARTSGGGVMPQQNSMMPQNQVRGTGLNGQTAFNTQQQPSGQLADPMEGARLMQDAAARGVFANEHMGMIGLQTPLPGNPTMMQGSQTNQTLGLVGFQNLDGIQPPGSTPTKTGKKKGKK
jgi:hypothetical protein